MVQCAAKCMSLQGLDLITCNKEAGHKDAHAYRFFRGWVEFSDKDAELGAMVERGEVTVARGIPNAW